MTLLLLLYLAVALLVMLFLAYTDFVLTDVEFSFVVFVSYLIAGLAWPIFLSVNVYYAIKYLSATRR